MNKKAGLEFFDVDSQSKGDSDPNQYLQDSELDNYPRSSVRNNSFGDRRFNSSDCQWNCMNKLSRLGYLVCIKNMLFLIFPN